MPTPTYDLIASTTLGSNTRTITFTSIPSTYRDLVLVCNVTVVGGSDLICLTFNNNTSGYNTVTMEGNGSTAASGSQTNESNAKNTVIDYSISDVRSTVIIQIFDYAQTDKHKSILMKGGSSNLRMGASANRWANTAAINRLDVFTDSGTTTYSSGSTFHLYGIVS
jgi:hypothetical protein